ncbi:MAG: hypothetical protein GY811_26955 [Myxococcales bacterium]|nr:hypothetical protein [Myxococcales bacterium]
MLKLHKFLFAASLSTFAIGGSYIYAEPGAEEGTETATVTNIKNAKLSNAEMQSQSSDSLEEMQDILRRIVELQQLARKQKDVIKLNCVNDKLLQVKQLLNIAEGGRTDLVEAIAQGDNDASHFQFSQITIAKEKTDVLRGEAEGCIGEELVFLGPTEVEVNEGNVTDDPTEDDDLEPADDILDPPGYASPFS